eukprot:6743132-Prymnesium_polylepis.1
MKRPGAPLDVIASSFASFACSVSKYRQLSASGADGIESAMVMSVARDGKNHARHHSLGLVTSRAATQGFARMISATRSRSADTSHRLPSYTVFVVV